MRASLAFCGMEKEAVRRIHWNGLATRSTGGAETAIDSRSRDIYWNIDGSSQSNLHEQASAPDVENARYVLRRVVGTCVSNAGDCGRFAVVPGNLNLLLPYLAYSKSVRISWR